MPDSPRHPLPESPLPSRPALHFPLSQSQDLACRRSPTISGWAEKPAQRPWDPGAWNGEGRL